MKIVLVPGWHEKAKYLDPFIDGRDALPGLRAAGFECVLTPDGNGAMPERVDEFAAFLDDLRAREPDAFPVGTFGYSAGGIVTRAFLRKYPERAHWVAGTFQLAAPNAGLVAEFAIPYLRLLRMPANMLKNLDVANEFMTWLNGTSGHWTPRADGGKQWVLDADPWIAPEGHPILCVYGSCMRRGPVSDGIVQAGWATLNGALPSFCIDRPTANHLNLGAAFDPMAFLTRGWRIDDHVWPQVTAAAVTFFRAAAAAAAAGGAA